jgi:hypothetical protein
VRRVFLVLAVVLSGCGASNEDKVRSTVAEYKSAIVHADVQGDGATARTADGGTLRLRVEDGRWRIDNP